MTKEGLNGGDTSLALFNHGALNVDLFLDTDIVILATPFMSGLAEFVRNQLEVKADANFHAFNISLTGYITQESMKAISGRMRINAIKEYERHGIPTAPFFAGQPFEFEQDAITFIDTDMADCIDGLENILRTRDEHKKKHFNNVHHTLVLLCHDTSVSDQLAIELERLTPNDSVLQVNLYNLDFTTWKKHFQGNITSYLLKGGLPVLANVPYSQLDRHLHNNMIRHILSKATFSGFRKPEILLKLYETIVSTAGTRVSLNDMAKKIGISTPSSVRKLIARLDEMMLLCNSHKISKDGPEVRKPTVVFYDNCHLSARMHLSPELLFKMKARDKLERLVTHQILSHIVKCHSESPLRVLKQTSSSQVDLLFTHGNSRYSIDLKVSTENRQIVLYLFQTKEHTRAGKQIPKSLTSHGKDKDGFLKPALGVVKIHLQSFLESDRPLEIKDSQNPTVDFDNSDLEEEQCEFLLEKNRWRSHKGNFSKRLVAQQALKALDQLQNLPPHTATADRLITSLELLGLVPQVADLIKSTIPKGDEGA